MIIHFHTRLHLVVQLAVLEFALRLHLVLIKYRDAHIVPQCRTFAIWIFVQAQIRMAHR